MDSEAIRRRAFNFGAWLMGIVFMLAAGLKAINVELFRAQVSNYHLIPEGSEYAASISIIIIEALLGAAGLAGFYARQALWGMILLMLSFVAATLLRWGALQGTDCNCFGQALGGGPESVLWHNALLIGVAATLIFTSGKLSIHARSRWLRAASGVVIVFLLMFVSQPSPLGSSPVSGAETEDHVRIFLSATCKQCQASSKKVGELLAGISEVPVRVYIGAQYEQQIKEFLNDWEIDINYIPVTFNQLAREAEQVPQVQLYHDGKPINQWEGEVPSLEEVKQALSLVPQAGGE